MKHYRIYLATAALVLASLACQAVTGGGNDDVNDVPSSNDNATQPEAAQPTAASNDSNDNSNSDSVTSTNFPLIADAFNIIEVGDGSIVYYTKLSAEDVMQFYRDEYTSRGYTEREIITSINDGILNIVFDGDPSGKAVVIQSVGLADGSRTVAIRFEDV